MPLYLPKERKTMSYKELLDQQPADPSQGDPLTVFTPVTRVASSDSEVEKTPSYTDGARIATTLVAAAALAACGGGGGGGSSSAATDNGSANAPPPLPPLVAREGDLKAATEADAARFLQQAQFASMPEEITAVRNASYAAYVRQQMSIPVEQTAWDWMESRGYGNEAVAKDYVYNEWIADFAIWNQLFTARDAMRKRVALALSEIFVVSFGSMEIDWRGYAVAAYWDILNKHAFGNFRDLLKDVTLSAAMGHFLNTKGNKKEDARTGRQPDENYAREIMQLFTIGLYQLKNDGTEQLSNGKPIETYTADDVSQLARVFTGYDYDWDKYGKWVGPFTYPIFRREYARQPMKLSASDHSTKEVKALNGRINIPANTDGAVALNMALDGLFSHPNVGPFICRQLIQRLVTSNPKPAYVERVTAAFNNNGQGVRGDMKAVISAILLDTDLRNSATTSDPGFGKVREPMVRLVQWGRTSKARSVAGSWKIGNLSDSSYSLGQSPFRSPSVFNFFRPGYVPPGTKLADAKATAPEMQLVNETTVGGYINYVTYFLEEGLSVNNPQSNNPDYVGNTDARDIKPDYSVEMGFLSHANEPTDADATAAARKFADRLNLLLCAGQMSAVTYDEIFKALKSAILVDHWNNETRRNQKLKASTPDKYKLKWVAAGWLMTMSSADYLVQK
jgi:uncharacterized protein (DUF1800 family)